MGRFVYECGQCRIFYTFDVFPIYTPFLGYIAAVPEWLFVKHHMKETGRQSMEVVRG